MKARAIFMPLLALGWACGAAAQQSPETRLAADRQGQILRDALAAFDQGLAVARDDPERAQALYREAAAGFQTLIAAGLRNAALEYNLGNTHFRLGELGHAILHYRRAQRLAPRDDKLAANLAYARRQVEPFIPVAGSHRLLEQLLFWHYGTSLRERFWAAAAVSAAGWLLLIARLHRPARWLLATGLILVAIGACAAVSAGWDMHEQSRYPSAVVMTRECFLRLGRGEAADLALKQPLGPGVELHVLQQRADWVEVRLPSGQTGWLPAAAIEIV